MDDIGTISAKKALYGRLYVSANDFHMAKQYAEHLLKKGWHSAPYERRGTIYMQQSAFTTALVVSYARPFTNSKGWPRFPTEFIVYTEQENQLHEKLLEFRHQVYAHSDSEKYSIHPYKIEDNVFTDIVGEPFRKLTSDDCNLLVSMIKGIQNFLLPRLAELRGGLVDEDTV